MINTDQIKEKMEVVDLEGMHVGTVDGAENSQIKLTKNDSADGNHHFVPTDWIESVQEDEVRLNKTASDIKAEWIENDDDEMNASVGGM